MYKKLGEGALSQVADEQLAVVLDGEMNSIAQIVKHMAGNMRSRWTDFLTTDGEKANRNRETEFVDPPVTRADVLAVWESGWRLVFAALEPLSDADLGREVRIRGSGIRSCRRSTGRWPTMRTTSARSFCWQSTSVGAIGGR